MCQERVMMFNGLVCHKSTVYTTAHKINGGGGVNSLLNLFTDQKNVWLWILKGKDSYFCFVTAFSRWSWEPVEAKWA